MTPESKPTVWQWLLLAAALVLLNASVTFHNVWPTVWITTRHELSSELAVLLLLLVAYASFVRPPARIACACLAAVLLAMSLGRYADVTAPALYGRPVNIYWDAQHLPAVAAMLTQVAEPSKLALLVLGTLALLGTLYAVFYFALTRVAAGLRVRPMRRALGTLAVALLTLYSLGAGLEWPARHWFSLPVSAMFLRQAQFLVEAYASETERELPIEPLEPSDLGRVKGADVILMFLESYGTVTYDRPAIASVVQPARAELEAAVAATGRRMVSAVVKSPTFGGGSWLAHSTLMSQHEVREMHDYNLLLTQERETLPKLFAAAGYRSIAWMPGLRNPWPEGAYYGFAQIVGERELAYRGPDLGWWRIPDQFALARLDDLELRPEQRPPLFVFFPTINTHVPFRPTPPYQPDWRRVLGPEPFEAAATAASLAQAADWTDLAPAYADTVAYTFTYLAGYLRERPTADLVLLLVGDHQPAASVSGQSARWDVPVHVITSRPEIANALLGFGFVEGVDLKPAGKPLGDMPQLTSWLLRAFDSEAAAGAYGSRVAD